MNLRQPLRLLLPCLAAIALPAGLLSAKAADRPVVVVSAVTKLGEHLDPVTPESPVAYQVMTRGFIEMGNAIAGEKVPDRDLFLQRVLATLRQRGFKPAEEGRTPAVALGITWGTLRGRREAVGTYLTAPPLPLMWRPSPDSSAYATTGSQMINDGTRSILAAINQGVAARIRGMTEEDVYFLTISAYDWKSAFAGRQVLLWQTRIATPARRTSAIEALTLCLRTGLPLLGQALAEPQWLTATNVAADATLPPTPAPEFDLTRLVVHDFTVAGK